MSPITFWRRFITCIGLAALLAGCSLVSGWQTREPTLAELPRATEPPTPSPTRTPTPIPSATPTPTPPPTLTFTPSLTPTATRDTRLDPVKWMDWPVVPAVSGRAREIYQRGLALGNNPHALSKVADCQGIKEVLLGNYEKPGWYKLSGENLRLQETINAFPGSLNRNGMAVMGGFNARTVLSPQHADPAFCLPGESPVECEYRVHKPSIAIISLEVYYDGRSVENYTQSMRQIIDFFIQRGVLPILSTKADNKEGDHRYNLTTARLAYEYDLPLWNWWRAAQALPNYGMDLFWSDGFHISPQAWNERSLTGLQAVDAVWRAVRELNAAPPAAPAPTPLAGEGLLKAAELPKAGATGRVIFGLAQHSNASNALQGVFVYDFDAGALVQVAPAGFDLQAVAPDGGRILLNRGAQLYSARPDGSDWVRLADDFYFYSWPLAGAAWRADGSGLVYLAIRDGEPGIYTAKADGSAPRRITGPGALPIGLLPSADPDRVAWQSGVCRAAGDCTRQAAFTTLEGKLERKWEGMLTPKFSADGKSAADATLNSKGELALAISTGGREFVWVPQLEGSAVDYSWSPGGKWLVELLAERDSYTGKAKGTRVFLFNNATFQSLEWASFAVMSGLAAWSPSGNALLLAGTEAVPGGYRINLRLVEFPNGRVKLALDGKIRGVSADYPFLTRVEWLP